MASYTKMVVDTAHGHIFFCGGAGDDGILVTDLAGNTVTTIPDQTGASDMVLSPDGSTLYAALSTGTATDPTYLAIAGGNIWFGYGPAAHGNIGSLNLSGASPVVTLDQDTQQTFYSAPMLASAPNGQSDTLVAGAVGQSPDSLASYTVTPAGTATRTAYLFDPGSNLQDMAVTPDGTDVVVASGSPYEQQVFRTGNLTPDGSYTTSAYPSAVAIAPDGTVAAGLQEHGPDVYVFAPAGSTPINTYSLAEGVDARGLAWGANDQLYAVTGAPGSTGAPTLHVISSATVSTTQLTLDAPASVTVGQPITIQGVLSSAAPFAAGTTVEVSRTDAADPAGVALAPATVGSGGSFSITDSPGATGSYTYSVSYSGDAQHQGSSATASVQLSKLAATPVLNAPATADPLQPVAVTGQLPNGPFPAGETVQVTRTAVGGQGSTSLADATVATNGSFGFTDVPPASGGYSYQVDYAGDTTHLAGTASAPVQVAQYASDPVLTAPATGVRNEPIKITGQLDGGPYPAGETVQITRTDLEHPTGTVLASVPVAADGSFGYTDTPQVGGADTYQVSYAGDLYRSSGSATATVQIARAATALSLSVNSASRTYGYGSPVAVTAHLGATYNGRTVAIYAQPFGGARVLVGSGSVNAAGNLTVSYRITSRTWFSAVFAGDDRYAPAGTGTYAYATAGLAEVQSGYYTSVRQYGEVYRVYHSTVTPAFAVAVAPDKAGECVRFVLQEHVGSAWRTIATAGCLRLGSNSAVAAAVTLRNAVGGLFRIDAEYLPSASDGGNLATLGAWQYLTVRR
jgi:hypothetical protein